MIRSHLASSMTGLCFNTSFCSCFPGKRKSLETAEGAWTSKTRKSPEKVSRVRGSKAIARGDKEESFESQKRRRSYPKTNGNTAEGIGRKKTSHGRSKENVSFGEKSVHSRS